MSPATNAVRSRSVKVWRISRSTRQSISVAVGMLLIVVVGLPCFMTAALIPEIRQDVALDPSMLGVGLAAFAAVGFLTSLLAGRFVDRIGGRPAIRLAAAMTGTCLLALVVHSTAGIFAVLAFSGVAAALAAPASSVLLARSVDRRRLGLAFGVQWAGGPLAAVVAGLAMPAIAQPFGWRWAFGVSAGAAAVVGVLAPPTDRARTGPASATGGSSVYSRPVLLLVAATAFSSAAGIGGLSFLVVSLTDADVSTSVAGLVLAGAALCASAARVAFGGLCDRTSTSELLLMARMLLVSCVGFVLLATGVPLLMIPAALVAGGLGWGWQGLVSLAMSGHFPAAPGRAAGAMMTGSFLGAASGPLMLGFIAQDHGFLRAWLVCGGLALGGVCLTYAAAWPRPARKSCHPLVS